MESEKLKEIKKALEENAKNVTWIGISFSKENGEIGLVEYADVLTLINELESENEKLKQHKRELQGGQQDLIKALKQTSKEAVKKFATEVYKELYQLGKIYALPETLDANKYGIFSLTQEVIAKIAKEQFDVEIKE